MEDNKKFIYGFEDETGTTENAEHIEEMETVEEKREWFSDEFEEHFKRAVPKKHSLILYKPKPKRMRKFLKNPVFAAVVSSLVTCCLCLGIFSAVYRPGVTLGSVLPAPGEALAAQGYSNDVVQVATGGTLGIPEIYALASPAVVTILCSSQSNSAYVQSAMSSGSGIIIRHDGYIVTNNHVIEGATTVTVNTIAGQSFEAKVVGADSRTDLAVLKVENDTALPFAELGDSSTLRVGEMALAIGNPLREELAGTLTVGYISAINRSMQIDGKQMTMIQTDAAINPGNSGGALLNMSGQVVGINTAKSTGYDVEGLGFAIPINEAKPVIESIITYGYVTGRPLIGVTGQSVTEAIARANNLPVGVYISAVSEDGGARKAGLRVGDVITACDGQKVTTIDEINKIRDSHKVGETLMMTIDRNGQTLEIAVVLQEEKPSSSEETKQPQQQQPYQQQIPFPFSWFGW